MKLSSKKMLLLSIFGLALSVAETYFQIWYSKIFSGLGIKTGAFVYSFAVILFLFSLNKEYKSGTIIWKSIVYIGKISFGIYLVHLYFLSFLIKPALTQLHLGNYFVNQLIMIITTLLCCVAIISVTRKINLKLATKYLGF